MANERVNGTPGGEKFLHPHILSKTNQLLQNFTAKNKKIPNTVMKIIGVFIIFKILFGVWHNMFRLLPTDHDIIQKGRKIYFNITTQVIKKRICKMYHP